MRLSIKYKVIIAFLTFSILPIIIISYISIRSLEYSGESVISLSVGSLEKEEENVLIKEAESYAKMVSDFLKDRENDLKYLASMPFNERTFYDFYKSKKGKVWYAKFYGKNILETKEELPFYKEIAYINEKGNEEILIKDGKIFKKDELRDVSKKENTTYLIEDYFEKTKEMEQGEIYLSDIVGFAMTQKEQLKNYSLDEIKGGKKYNGVLRFSIPVYRDNKFKGILTLALDHIHLQELSIHILPKIGYSVVFPSYQSGNYAFIFDKRGWIVTHPKYWDFPGVFKNGTEKKPMTENSNKREIDEGIVGFNLKYAGFISEGYPKAYDDVMKGKSGIVTVTNVGGIKKVMAYAPIFYKTKNSEIYGGFTLGAELNTFWETTKKSKTLLSQIQLNYQKKIFLLFLVITIIIGTTSVFFGNHLVKPIVLLSKKTKFFGDTDFEKWKKIDREDEIGDLARAFYEMNLKILEQKESLIKSMEEIEKTKKIIEDYNVYLRRQVELLTNEETRQADRLTLIGKLAASLAHEIRNPLTGITLFLDDLHDRLKNDPESQSLIVHSLKEIERLERLVKGLLEFSASKPTSKTLFEVEELIDSVEILIKKQCSKKGIKLLREKANKKLYVLGDKEKILQAVLNIALNAIDIMGEGGELLLSTKFIVTDEAHYVVLDIKDTGPGIDEENIDKIFEPYFTTRKGGTGLGLAISRSIITEHNGIIFAKNYEKGAVFEIWLPFSQEGEKGFREIE